MSLNLHSAVRGAIPAVNPDIPALWLRSTGYTVDANGKQVPGYAAPCRILVNAQPPSGKALNHANYMNIGGTTRSVYMFSDPQSVVRIDAKGGDLLQFPQWRGAPVDNWLVTLIEEAYAVDEGGWSKVMVVLQTDRPS